MARNDLYAEKGDHMKPAVRQELDAAQETADQALEKARQLEERVEELEARDPFDRSGQYPHDDTPEAGEGNDEDGDGRGDLPHDQV